jgi:hypothetical protein
MAQNFNAAAVTALFGAIVSAASGLGDFQRVNAHEPKNAPGSQLSCSFWLAGIKAVTSSGLAATSGLVTFSGRVYKSALAANAKEFDAIDPVILTAACDLMAAFSTNFTLDGTVREIDLLGQFGTPLSAEAAYVEMDGKQYRVMEIQIPIVIDDLWTQQQ